MKESLIRLQLELEEIIEVTIPALAKNRDEETKGNLNI
jgi:hypothetical protein